MGEKRPDRRAHNVDVSRPVPHPETHGLDSLRISLESQKGFRMTMLSFIVKWRCHPDKGENRKDGQTLELSVKIRRRNQGWSSGRGKKKNTIKGK